MDNPFKSPVILSLCTGMRGLERGIERAFDRLGWKHPTVAAFLEIEAFVIENLVQQMEQGVLAPAPVWSNLKTFPSEQFHGKIHGITGGYPCQPFSFAGNRKGTDDPRHLWPHIKSMVGAIRPVWCFFENVPGHLTLGYREVRSDLELMGYTVKEGIFSADEVGAPHQRKRLFILAVDHSRCQRSEPKHAIRTRRNRVEHASEVANPEHNGYFTPEIGESIEEGNGSDPARSNHDLKFEGLSFLADSFSEWELQQKGSISDVRGRISNSGFKMANSNCRGSGKNTEQSEFWPDCIEQSPSYCWEADTGQNGEITGERWPAHPGQPQYDWEEPRIKPSVGFTINGYNFREDLLRMAGNGVVEQTAELAFRTLLAEHGIEI